VPDQKEFFTIEEVATMTQRNRGTIYNRIRLLGIKTRKFPQNRKTYVSSDDAAKIKLVIEEPWRTDSLEEKQ
jgi:hypothetical protein